MPLLQTLPGYLIDKRITNVRCEKNYRSEEERSRGPEKGFVEKMDTDESWIMGWKLPDNSNNKDMKMVTYKVCFMNILAWKLIQTSLKE